MENQTAVNTYEVSMRLLGNEIFALALKSSDSSNRWVIIGMVTMFSLLTVLGAYGEKLANLAQIILK